MKSKTFLKKALPHLGAILFFFLLTIIYFSPVFFDGKDLPQGDIISSQGMVKDVENYYKETGESSVWSNAMFGGMPVTFKYGQSHPNIFHRVADVMGLMLPPLHARIMFFYLLGFYIFLVSLRVRPLLAILGAVAYAFASYNFIIIEAGHVNKAYPMACMAPILGGVLLAFRGKYVLGSIITLVFLGIQLGYTHIQITYYTMLMVFVEGIVYFIYAIREKWLPRFLKAFGFLAIAAVLAILPNASLLYPTYDYSKDTMRGGAELSIHPDDLQHKETPNTGGLEKDYAFAWSYGKMETFTLLVPNLYGGGHDIIDPNSKTGQELRSTGANIGYLPTYWGDQPFTSGPAYAGAIVCFLFILGFFLVKGPEKWWILGATIFSFFLAWGRHFDVFNDLIFRHLPFYSSFRTPSMALVMAEVTMPFMAVLALKEIFTGKIEKQELIKKLKYAFYITGGLCLLLLAGAVFSVFEFSSAGDAGFAGQLKGAGFPQPSIDSILDILARHRKSMMITDVIRSLVFILLAFSTLWIYLKGKLKKEDYVVVILTVLIIIDLWAVDKRYLNNDNFKPRKQATTIQPTEADLLIMQDKDLDYRVFNAATNTFNESMTSAFHKSVGGYSPIKLRRYQDLIDFYMSKGIEMRVLNMLNTRYFIVPGGQIQQNPDAYGNAWFANDYKMVQNADEEILALKDKNIDLLQTAVIDKRFTTLLGNYHNTKDSLASIALVAYKPNHLTYKAKTSKDRLAVFSEVFYDKYWKVYVDGKEVPHFRANYILRSMIVPAGEHTIEFKAKSAVLDTSYRVSLWASILVTLLVIGSLGWVYYSHKKDEKKK